MTTDTPEGLAAELAAADYEWRGPFGREKHRRISPALFDRILTALKPEAVAEVAERCAKIAEGFSRMRDKPDHADAPKLIAAAIRASVSTEASTTNHQQGENQ